MLTQLFSFLSVQLKTLVLSPDLDNFRLTHWPSNEATYNMLHGRLICTCFSASHIMYLNTTRPHMSDVYGCAYVNP